MYRVVIVDDEPFMLEGMRLMIEWEKHGFTVCAEASSAQEALHLIDACKPHLLITDVRMPGMLGTDLAGIVRHYHPQTVLLFFSGYKDFSFAQSAIRSNAFGYLVKPIDRDEVHKTLDEIKDLLDSKHNQNKAEGEQLSILRDHVLRRIANGDTGEESLLRAGVLLDIKRGESCYCAAVTMNAAFSQGALMMLSSIGGIPFALTPAQYGLCFKQMERDLQPLEDLCQLMKNSFGLLVQIGVGPLGKGSEGFGYSLCRAMDALGVLFEPYGSLRIYRDVDESAAKWMVLSSPTKLMDALEEGSTEKIGEWIQRTSDLAYENKPSLFALRYMVKTIETMLASSRRVKDGLRQWVQTLKPLWNEQAMEWDEWLNAFMKVMRSLNDVKPDSQNDPLPVRAVLDTLENEYDRALSLGAIAEELHLNPAYLGQLVLRATGKTFHALLLDTRISHACRLLRQTSQPVGEIAYAVGFRDVEYFSRQFRACMAMSPNAYRSGTGLREGIV